jgi:nucleoside-diphosphate-sugar epimerase
VRAAILPCPGAFTEAAQGAGPRGAHQYRERKRRTIMSRRILILGVNGFIGSSLSEYILKNKDWEVYGMDMASDKIGQCLGHDRFHFVEGDITINKEWIEYHIKKCDVVLPLVAIATPATYVLDPLRVFELDFEANLDAVRKCVRYKKRVLFPSTSEVYGMSTDREFDEETSNFVLGPINKQRWIYSCSKQLMDRVIHAYGMKEGLRYTLFRPFNFIGPKLDNILEPKEGSSRVLTQFIGNILRGRDIMLVDGGTQRRSFTYIDDGVDALARIIENKDNAADGRIFNIGNPKNDTSIRELAETLIELIKTYPKYAKLAENVKLVTIKSDDYYGAGYQDIQTRVPSVKNAEKYLGWKPTTDLKTSLRKTLDYHLDRPSSELSE